MDKRIAKYRRKLEKYFGYPDFREKQAEIVDHILHGRDVCAVMPTGHGKSLCFQFPALYSKKVAVIISPLISLMEDQRLDLRSKGISVCCLNSAAENSYDVLNEITDGEYSIVYMTPEYAIKAEYLFCELESNERLCVVAIDEAHTVSSWGHEFRDAYRRLNCVRDWLEETPILTLTATATDRVVSDICSVMQLENPAIIKTSFDRPNLKLSASLMTSDPYHSLKPLLGDMVNGRWIPKTEKIIIYCSTRNETNKTAELLQEMGVPCLPYHAGLTNEVRMGAHHKFIDGEISCMVATIAFGMGIDLPDIRQVIHINAPKNPESYYQEIGRAGRDGQPSSCHAFYRAKDFATNKSFLRDLPNQRHKKHMGELIRQMERYLTSNECRRKLILAHFGQEYEQANCANCDNCLREAKEVERVDFTEEAKMLIGLIQKTRETYGRTILINILRGSKNKKMTPKLQKLSYYNQGSKHSEKWWSVFVRMMVSEGYLNEVQISGGYGAKIEVSDLGEGWMVLQNTADDAPALMLDLNEEMAQVHKPAKKTQSKKPKKKSSKKLDYEGTFTRKREKICISFN